MDNNKKQIDSLSQIIPPECDGVMQELNECRAENESQAKFMRSVDKINHAIQNSDDLNEMMSSSLDAVLEIFECDRASLITPCDPKAPSWHIAMERTTEKYPSDQAAGFEVRMSPQVAEDFKIILKSEKPVKYSPTKESILLKGIAKKFEAKSVIAMAITPRVGSPWKFMIEQYSHEREWDYQDEVLFMEIGNRLAESITSFLAYCDFSENEIQLKTLVRTIPDLVWMKDTHGIYLSCNPEFEKFFGAKEADILGKTDFDFVPRELAEFFLKKDLEAIALGGPNTNEEWVTYASDGHQALLETVKTPVRDAEGKVLGVLGVARDITERKKADEERKENLKFMESMDKINRAIQGTNDLEKMMSNALDAILEVFDCDRSWIVTPCDPWTLAYRVPMERTKPEYPGASKSGMDVPVDPDTTILFQKTRATDGPVVFNTKTDPPLPVELTKHFQVQSQMVMEIHPSVEESWMVGMHQCSYEREWTEEEKRLFQEVGRRIADSLTALLVYRDLQKKESEYRRVVETANEGILILNRDRKFVFVNKRLLQVLGYEQKEMLAHRIEDFIADNELDDHSQQMGIRKNGESSVYERHLRRKDGTLALFNVSAVPLYDDKRQFDGSFAMLTDITDRKNTEDQLLEQARYSQSLLRFSRDLEQSQAYGEILFAASREIGIVVGYTHVWVYGITDDNKHIRKISAVSPTKGKTNDVYIDNRAPLVLISGDPMLEALTTTKETVVVEDAQTDPTVNHELVKELGNRTIVNVPIILFERNLGIIGMGTFGEEGVHVPTKNEKEYLTAMASHIAVAFDRIRLLDERRMNEESLRKNAEELEEAQRIGNLGSFDWDIKTNTVFWSKECYRILDVDPLQKTLTYEEQLKLYTPQSIALLDNAVKNSMQTGDSYELDLEHILRSGAKSWVSAHGEVKRDEGNNISGIHGTIQDITEAKEIEEMRVNFLMLASHQLRTPLSGTKWLIETLKSGLQGPINEKQKEYLDYLESVNERMIRLVSDMLLAIRTESTETIFQYVAVSIPVIFTDITSTAGAAAVEKNIRIHDASSAHHLPQVVSDPKFLSIILGSFLSNAINYSPADSEIIFDVKEEEGAVALSVQDFGIGIPEEERPHVLERFFRAANAKSLRPEGTGLGLYIADMFAKKMGGSITYTSEVNKGSTFVLHLPKR